METETAIPENSLPKEGRRVQENRLYSLQKEKENFFAYYFLKVQLHHFSKIKFLKKSQSSRNKVFFYYFYLLMEGYGSVSLTNGSGSGRPKNLRIRNTDSKGHDYSDIVVFVNMTIITRTVLVLFRCNCIAYCVNYSLCFCKLLRGRFLTLSIINILPFSSSCFWSNRNRR